jgi:hypothetical protein
MGGNALTCIAIALTVGGIPAQNTLADPATTRGSADGARRYYRDISKSFDGLSLAPGVTTLDDVTSFVGYPISGDRLETLDPGILMNPERLASEGGMGGFRLFAKDESSNFAGFGGSAGEIQRVHVICPGMLIVGQHKGQGFGHLDRQGPVIRRGINVPADQEHRRMGPDCGVICSSASFASRQLPNSSQPWAARR